MVIKLTETSLPRVKNRKEFVDCLSDMINPPKDDEGVGRMRILKSYIVESDHGVQESSFQTSKMSFNIVDTDVEKLKIIQISSDGVGNIEMFLDIQDSRFLVLHTNVLSDLATYVIEELVDEQQHGFDHTWFHSMFLRNLPEKEGNEFHGIGIKYSNEYLENRYTNPEDLGVSASGSLATRLLQIVENDDLIKHRSAYNKIGIMRGDMTYPDSFVQDEISNNGYFSVRRGKSVQDHLMLIDMVKEDYANTMKIIEDNRIGLTDINGRTLVEGRPFDFIFHNKIEDLESFTTTLFNCAKPFKLWGIKSQITRDYFRIAAVDLHTGTPMNFEVADDLVRVYLSKDCCGNTILRLLTNLQTYFDSSITCKQVPYCVSK